MIKWFEGNLPGVVLASICGGLLLISLLLGVIWTLQPGSVAEDIDGEEAGLILDVPQLGDSEPIDAYAVISERPVFNESRLPVIEDGQDQGEEELLAEEVDAPEVELAGVIITPTIRMVTLRSKDQSESLVAFEGQPLEGNYGTWQVSEITPREITLSSGSGKEVQLQLQVHDVKIPEPPKMEKAESEETGTEQPGAEDGENDRQLTRAEEIRERIAQRREELRLAAEAKGEEEVDPAEYRKAIQSMVTGVRRKDKNDEDDR